MTALRWIVLALMLLALTAASGWWWRTTRLENSQDSPIFAAASRYEVDPALIKAIVWRESRFNPLAHGKAGELGLMQLQELAAQEWADAEHVIGFTHEHCLDPRTNTLCGTFYFKRLLQRYRQTDNPVPYALADYNAGRANVLHWNEGAAVTNSALFVQQIGFPGTRDYVLAVMKRARRYHGRR